MPSLFFREEGSGPPLVFLHGFCETHEIWNDFIKPLSTQFRIITPDLPGFGKSAILPTPFTIDQVGSAVATWLIENQIAKCIIIGHSLGGYVALSIVERCPQLLLGIGLFHSSVFADTEEKKESRSKVIEFVNKHGVQPYIDTFVPGLFFDKSSPAIPGVHVIASQSKIQALVGYLLAMRDRPDRSFVLTKGEIPAFLIVGTEDNLITIETSRKMAKIGQKSNFYELKDVGHMGFFEAKNDCQTIINRFAKKIFFNN